MDNRGQHRSRGKQTVLNKKHTNLRGYLQHQNKPHGYRGKYCFKGGYMAIGVQNKVMGNKHYHKRKHTFIIGKQIQMVLGRDIWHQEKHIVIGSKHGKIFGTNGGKHIHIGTKYLWGKHTIKIGKQKYTTLGKMCDTWVKLSVIGGNNFSRCKIYGNREKKPM